MGNLGQVHEPNRTERNSEERQEVNPRLAFLWKNKKGMENGVTALARPSLPAAPSVSRVKSLFFLIGLFVT